MKDLLLGVDLGTSACKAAVFSRDGTALAFACAPYPVRHPRPGWAEQDPGDWWNGARRAVGECLSAVDPGRVAAVGVDGQSWSCAPVDEAGDPLMPCPIWQDTRAAALCREVAGTPLGERLFERGGNPFQPFYTTPKLLWVREHRPEVWRRARWFLQSNSYIVLRLTGRATQDRSQCYGLHCYDKAGGELDLELCRDLGLDPERLPPVFPCQEIVGEVTPAAERETGIPAGTPVAAGGLDAACGAFGAGVCRPGQTQEQGGQAGGMSVCVDSPRPDPRLILSPHIIPGLWLLQGGTVGGGAALRWLAGAVGQEEAARAAREGRSQLALVDELAGETPPGADGLVFLPYLMGERSPIWDPEARGMFFGLTFATGRGHLYRAVMEGAAYALRHNLEAAGEAGAAAGELRSMGGAAGSPLWMQIKADVTGRRLRSAGGGNAAAWGAACLGGVGAGVYRDLMEAAELAPPSAAPVYRPREAYAPVYEEGYRIYRELYHNTKELMAASRRLERLGSREEN